MRAAFGGGSRCALSGLVRTFEGLRILRYEDQQQRGDFFDRKVTPVVRLLAEKPAQ